MMDTNKEYTFTQKLAKKYGRVAILFLFVALILMSITGVRPTININPSKSSSKSGSTVVIQGSTHVNPSNDYWTSNKFDF